MRPDSIRPPDTAVDERSPVAWSRVFRWLLPYWRQELLLLALMVIGIGLSLLYPLFLREIADELSAGADGGRVLGLAGWLLLATASGLLLSAMAGWLQTWVTARVLLDLREAAYAHLQRLGPAFFARRRLGDVLQRIGGDLADLQQVATGTLVGLLGAIISGLAALFALSALQPRLLAVALLAVPPALLLLLAVRPLLRRFSLWIRERSADVSHHMLETLAGLRTVLAHGMAERERERFVALNRALLRVVLRHRLLDAGSAGAFQLLSTLSLLAVLVAAAGMVREGRMSIGDVIAFALFQQRLMGPVQGLAGTWMQLQRAAAPIARVFELLDARPDFEPRGLRRPDVWLGSLEFRGVSYSYDPGRGVLKDVSFEVPAGRTLALVGPSGAGKSTVLDLLLGFLPPETGTVRIDGIDLRELDLDALRPRIAVVTQPVALFDGSLRENLSWLEPDRDDAELEEALQRVGLLDWAAGLQEGLATPLGDRGVRLSEGQRQRIGIARALLRDPLLLVLDEATAALDPESDRVVAAAVAERRARGRTTLLVTHRLAWAAAADDVVVLDERGGAERGSHADLLEKSGRYRRMWEAQGPLGPAVAASL